MPKGNRALETIYQKKLPVEDVLLHPDTYIGSVERQRYLAWVHDGERMVYKELSVVPGLYKTFDEILVSAAMKARDPPMSELRINVDPIQNLISVWNNGKGIPIDVHRDAKMYIPELIFGNLLTGSDFDDDEKKLTGGRNEYGAKLTNIFSTEFTVQMGDGFKEYKQTFYDNMGRRDEPRTTAAKSRSSWTCISYRPDLEKFGMAVLDEDIVSVMRRRAYDMAGVLGSSVSVYFNKEKIKLEGLMQYVSLFVGSEAEGPARVHYSRNGWEVVVVPCSDGEFSQMSFVNAIATMKGGTHVNYIADQLCKGLAERLKKKDIVLTNSQLKSRLHIFVNCRIENPAFDSQTKENMTTPADFGSTCLLPQYFLNEVARKGMNLFVQLKNEILLKRSNGKKTSILNIEKLDDAELAGTRRSAECTLILTEGDSAKSGAVAGLTVVGRKKYGVFPLRGKLLNVRDASAEAIAKNEEIQHLKKIIGLKHNTVYTDVKKLRYGHIMIMTDQDFDGSHIKGLILNFLHHCSPSLLRLPSFIQMFVTPIIKVWKGDREIAFYTTWQFEEWKNSVGSAIKKWSLRYYKGLGTSTRHDSIKYFENLAFHTKTFVYDGEAGEDALDRAFSKKRVTERKSWLSAFQEGTFLDHTEEQLSFTDFVNKELILFSLADTDRSIPSLMDGFKVTQRKIIFGCFKRGNKTAIKVIQLVGYVGQHAAYHHGEKSLATTIVALAHNYVGSNNINLLVPDGQFGTRLKGGEDAASPRYLHTFMTQIARYLFKVEDDDIVVYLDEDEQRIQPKFYVPVIPFVLINGADGIGTGWSTSIPNFNPIDVIDNTERMVRGQELVDIHPWYVGYEGSIEPPANGGSYSVTGKYEVDEDAGTIEILDLALKKWTEDYKKFLNDCLVAPNPIFSEYEDKSTDTTVHYILTVTPAQMKYLKGQGIPETLKLTGKISLSNMVLFDQNGHIRKFETVREIFEAFYPVRLEFYGKRKEYMLKEARDKMKRLDNQVRFIKAVVEGRLVLNKRKLDDVIADLERMGFDRMCPEKKRALDPESEEGEDGQDSDASYKYLLNMPVVRLTLEEVERLEREYEKQEQKVAEIETMTLQEMWLKDLAELRQKYEEHLEHTLRTMELGRFRFGAAPAQGGNQQRGRGRGRRGARGGRGGVVGRAGPSAAPVPQSAGRRGGSIARGRGRGGGRTAAESSSRAGETSGESSLANRFGVFGLGGSTSANPEQPAPIDLTAIEEEVTSPVRPRPKRRIVVMMNTDSDEESEEEQKVEKRGKRPRTGAAPYEEEAEENKEEEAEEQVEEEQAIDFTGETEMETNDADSDSDYVIESEDSDDE